MMQSPGEILNQYKCVGVRAGREHQGLILMNIMGLESTAGAPGRYRPYGLNPAISDTDVLVMQINGWITVRWRKLDFGPQP
jgi:hypothetical protein